MEEIKCPVCGESNWIRPEENKDPKSPSTPAVRKCGNPKCNALHPIDSLIEADGLIFDMDKHKIVCVKDLERME